MKIVAARVPACLLDTPPAQDPLPLVDITLDGERIALVEPAATAPPGERADGAIRHNADGGIVLPAFVDMHTHLDKGHIWPRAPNPDGTFMGALHAVGEDRRTHWSAEDLRPRMEFALRCAHHHGTAAIRTHLDTVGDQGAVSWPLFAELRERWRDRIALQGVSLTPIDDLGGDLAPLFDLVTGHGGIVGAVLYPGPALQDNLAALMEMAEARGADIDFHADETLDPSSRCLAAVAAQAQRIGFSGTITVGHCCSLMTMPEAEADRTLDAVADAGIAIVSLPLCNLYLQDRDPTARRTPRIRGGTLVHEMAARGIPVALASDNTRDPFYAYGDLDMAEVYREATRVLHLDHPVGLWPRAVSATPAALMGLADRDRIGPGAPADLVVFRAREWSELFARPQTDRTVIRRGKILATTLPDYRELS